MIGGIVMYTFEFIMKKSKNEPAVQKAFVAYTTALELNGQILRRHKSYTEMGDEYHLRVVAPEETSFDHSNENVNVTSARQRFETEYGSEVKWTCIGPNCNVSHSCHCDNSDYYILKGNMKDTVSPVLCGNCGKSVPLYRLPRNYQREEYYDILEWQRAYNDLHDLFKQGLDERYAYEMLNKANSSLNVEGRRIAKALNEKTGVRVYYHMFKFYGKNKDECPICGEDWKNNDDEYNVNYICHRCRLVSEDVE
jgi:predicted  nucleic acid-binding Zn ribbon protein